LIGSLVTRLRRVSFLTGLAAISIAAFVVRVAYVIAFADRLHVGLDSTWYRLVAGTIAGGDGFIDPEQAYTHGVSVATAFRPPLYPLFLAGVDKTVGDTTLTLQLAGCVMGVVTVVLVGLLGKRIGGNAVGLCAAAMAAVYPIFLAVDAAIMSETLYLPLATGCVLAVYRAIDRPTIVRWSLAGALTGAAILTRGDGLLLLALVVVPAAVIAPQLPWRRRVLIVMVPVVAAALVVTPWVVRNNQRLGTPVVATLQTGTALAGAYCDDTFHGKLLGSWSFECTTRPDHTHLGEVALNNELQRDATRYLRHHAGRLAVVVPVRILRQWSLYDPVEGAHFEAIESRNFKWQMVSWATYLPIAVLAVYGLVLLRRRRAVVLPMVAMIVAVAATAAMIYGQQRLRISVEPVLLVAAAVAVVHLADRVWGGVKQGA
jgi:4-amino-4-deoxy-L-arabinose transferase-like glycosyltransferase